MAFSNDRLARRQLNASAKAHGGLGAALDRLFADIASEAAATFDTQGAQAAVLAVRRRLDDDLERPWRTFETQAALLWAKPARRMLAELRAEIDAAEESQAIDPTGIRRAGFAPDPVTEQLDREIAARARDEIDRQILDGKGTIVNHVLDKVSVTLSESQMSGIGVEAAARALRNRGGLETYRAFRIARTEIHQGLNAVTQTAAAQLVPDAWKVWMAQYGDGRTRKSHAEANGQRRRQDGLFSVGGDQLRWPGDRAFGAGAKQIVNCRCALGYQPLR